MTVNNFHKLGLTMAVTLLTLTACGQVSDKVNEYMPEREEVDTARVHIQPTPPLIAGQSVSSSMQIQADAIDNMAKQSVVTNKNIAEGTAEFVLKKALDTMYFGNAADAAQYFNVSNLPDLAKQLENTQPAFQQTVDTITITNVKYNSDKSEAEITGSIKLYEVENPESTLYRMKKINGKWKIMN